MAHRFTCTLDGPSGTQTSEHVASDDTEALRLARLSYSGDVRSQTVVMTSGDEDVPEPEPDREAVEAEAEAKADSSPSMSSTAAERFNDLHDEPVVTNDELPPASEWPSPQYPAAGDGVVHAAEPVDEADPVPDAPTQADNPIDPRPPLEQV